MLLEPVPQGQQFLAIAAQLSRHLRRGGALSDPAQDHQELRGTAMGPLQGGPREGVEDSAATAALEVHEGRAMAAVNPQVLPLSAARASQAVRMEQFDEFGVAGVLVQRIEQGEVHGQNLRVTRGILVEDTTVRDARQEAEHQIPLMSQAGIPHLPHPRGQGAVPRQLDGGPYIVVSSMVAFEAAVPEDVHLGKIRLKHLVFIGFSRGDENRRRNRN